MVHKFTTYRVKLSATVGGVQFDDVIKCQLAWEQNTIAACILQVATGQDIRTGKKATIETAGSTLKLMDEVTVSLTISDQNVDSGEKPLWDGTRVIFKGVFMNYGRTRTTESYSYTLHCQHFAAKLNYSSSLCSISHPGNPFAFTCPAIFRTLSEDSQATGAAKGAFIPVVTATTFAPSEALDDLWGNAILKVFKALANAPPLDKGLFGGASNKTALEALEKMGPGVQKKPLKIDAAGADFVTVGKSIQTAMTQEVAESWYHTTLWGKLLDLGAQYCFDVIPRVDDIQVVPGTVPLTAGKEYKTIKAEDVVAADFPSLLKQAVRAVCLLAPISYFAYRDNQASMPSQVDISGAAAVYPEPANEVGLVITREVPRWLVNITLAREGADVTAGATNKPVGGLDDASTGEDAPNSDPSGKVAGMKTLAGRFAETYYANEVLKSSIGEVSTRLRFDICPGSNVKVEAPPDLFAGDTSHKAFYCRVLRVTISIDAESQQCGTSFSLDQARIQKDAENPQFSSDGPPLYTQAFAGAPLGDDLVP